MEDTFLLTFWRPQNLSVLICTLYRNQPNTKREAITGNIKNPGQNVYLLSSRFGGTLREGRPMSSYRRIIYQE